MNRDSALRNYLFGAFIVWVGITVAIAMIDSDQFGAMIPILGGGAFWFIVIAPNLFREKNRSE